MTNRLHVPFTPGSGRYGQATALLVGNYAPSISAARSLSRAGYRVIAGDGGEYSTVHLSRDCAERWVHPPIRERDAFLEALSAFLQRHPEVRVVLPLRPSYVEVLATGRDRLPADPIIAMPQPEVVLTCLDKDRMYALARELDVPHHPIAIATDLAELLKTSASVGFPCVVRPASDTGPRLPGDRKAVICADTAAVERAFRVWPAGHRVLLVQRYAPGPRMNVFFAAHGGRILGQVQTRILRTDRADGTGLAIEGVTVARDARLDRACDALVGRLGYTGVGFAQFIVPDREDPHFLEINPRHAGSTAIASHVGLDLVVAAVGLASNPVAWAPPSDFDYPLGQRYVWTSRDLYAVATAVSRREIGPRRAARWLGDTARAAIGGDAHLTWSPRDPLPTLAVYAHLVTLGPWRRSRRARRAARADARDPAVARHRGGAAPRSRAGTKEAPPGPDSTFS